MHVFDFFFFLLKKSTKLISLIFYNKNYIKKIRLSIFLSFIKIKSIILL